MRADPRAPLLGVRGARGWPPPRERAQLRPMIPAPVGTSGSVIEDAALAKRAQPLLFCRSIYRRRRARNGARLQRRPAERILHLLRLRAQQLSRPHLAAARVEVSGSDGSSARGKKKREALTAGKRFSPSRPGSPCCPPALYARSDRLDGYLLSTLSCPPPRGVRT